MGDPLVRPADVHLLTNVGGLGLLFLLGPLTGGYSPCRTLGCPPNRQLWGPSDVGTGFLYAKYWIFKNYLIGRVFFRFGCGSVMGKTAGFDVRALIQIPLDRWLQWGCEGDITRACSPFKMGQKLFLGSLPAQGWGRALRGQQWLGCGRPWKAGARSVHSQLLGWSRNSVLEWETSYLAPSQQVHLKPVLPAKCPAGELPEGPLPGSFS